MSAGAARYLSASCPGRPSVLLYRLSAMALMLAATALPGDAQTSTKAEQSWQEQKCVLYQRAVTDALRFLDTKGIRPEFLARNDAFIAKGCLSRGDVCPQTEAELEFANLLTLMTMNEGMASSFVPFGCR